MRGVRGVGLIKGVCEVGHNKVGVASEGGY